MAAKLNRRMTRETGDCDPCKGERIMVEFEADGRVVHLRCKKRRKRFTTTWREIFRWLIGNEIRAIRKKPRS